jgi:hypothetical protein
MQLIASQFRGASTWIFCPLISNEMPLPACAAVPAIRIAAAARVIVVFMGSLHPGLLNQGF